MRDFIPADTVDANGKVWDTVGENIRSGEKDFSANDIKAIADLLFPVGSVYCGENPLVLSIGTWDPVLDAVNLIKLGSKTIPSGGYSQGKAVLFSETEKAPYINIRMWKRVS